MLTNTNFTPPPYPIYLKQTTALDNLRKSKQASKQTWNNHSFASENYNASMVVSATPLKHQV